MLTWFLFAWLVLSAGIAIWTRCRSMRQDDARRFAELEEIAQTLGSLTDWQRSFLIRFIVGDTMQIKEWEIGGYKAVWGPEVEVLCSKGIITRHFSGVFEIAPRYWKFLKAFWDPATERLNWPPAET